MITDIIAQEQDLEERLRFQFEFNATQINKAIKIIGREFPDLRSEDLASLQNLSKLASNFLVNPERINTIFNFSLSFGAELEASIILNGIPYPDYFNVQSKKFQEALDQEIETMAFAENLRMPGFIPTDFDHITGWTAQSVLSVKESVEKIIEGQKSNLSLSEVEDFVIKNPSLFASGVNQALRLYRFVILKNLTDIIMANLKQIFEDILLVAGSSLYSEITLTLGRQLNVDNKRTLETNVDVERKIINQAVRAANTYGAIFPQLRS